MPHDAGQSHIQLARQVLNLLREERLEIGHHLREQYFADMLGVSRTPVRSAFRLLQQLGAIEARKNHGFFLAMPADSLGGIVLEVPASGDQALYETLVRDRLVGAIPISITQTDIMRRYGADRVTMMRALSRLAEDGLIARNRGHGWSFQPSFESAATLKGSYDFRLVVEPAALLMPSFAADPQILDKSRRQHLDLLSHADPTAVGAARLFETDAGFHEMLAEFSRNVFIVQVIQQQNRLRRLLEFNSYTNRWRIGEWCNEHIAIIEAVQAGDRGQASRLMHRHLSLAYAGLRP